MQVENLQLVTILTLVLAGLFVLEGLIFLGALIQMKRISERLHKRRDPASSTAGRLLSLTDQLLNKLEPYQNRLSGLANHTESTLEQLRLAVGRADESAGRGLSYLQQRTRQTEKALDRFLSSFSQQTYRVHRAVLDPAIHASALVKGARAALGRLFSREGHRPPSVHHPDQDHFI